MLEQKDVGTPVILPGSELHITHLQTLHINTSIHVCMYSIHVYVYKCIQIVRRKPVAYAIPRSHVCRRFGTHFDAKRADRVYRDILRTESGRSVVWELVGLLAFLFSPVLLGAWQIPFTQAPFLHMCRLASRWTGWWRWCDNASSDAPSTIAKNSSKTSA